MVPDFRLNKAFAQLNALPQPLKDKVEFLCNECCFFGWPDRKAATKRSAGRIWASPARSTAAPRRTLLKATASPRPWKTPASSAWRISGAAICPWDSPTSRLRGRGLGSALILEFLLYYMTKPEHQLKVREEIYLDNMLDLF